MYLGDIRFDAAARKIIKEIDGVDYLDGHRFISKYDDVAVKVTELSTGCKTALNIYSFPEKIFYIGESGDNAKQTILGFSEGNAFVDYFFIP